MKFIYYNHTPCSSILNSVIPVPSSPTTALPSDTRVVLAAVRLLLYGFLRDGRAYKKAGVWLMDLSRPGALQADLFNPARMGDDKLIGTLDAINRRFGRGTAGLGDAAREPLAALYHLDQ